jgi:hypothetical protein
VLRPEPLIDKPLDRPAGKFSMLDIVLVKQASPSLYRHPVCQ